MGQKLIKAVVAILISAILAIGLPLVAFAWPNDATITLQSRHVYRNLAEADDMAVIFHWRWVSDNYSATPASSTIFIELSINGTIQSAATPYVFSLFENNGYGDGMTGFYLSAATVPEWEGAYTIRIAGLPMYYSPYGDVPFKDFYLESSDYTSSTTQEDNRAELKTYILDECDIFKTIYPDVALKSVSSSGTTLSDYGEAYFTSTIPGLQTLCPDLFYIQTLVPEVMTVQAYDMSRQTITTARLEGTDLKRGAERLGTAMGVSWAVVWGIFTLIGCLVVAVKCAKKGWGVEVGLFINGCIVTAVALLVGDLMFTLVMVGGLLAIIGISWALFGKRA